MDNTSHSKYMSHALQLAEQGRCTVSPNPMVGCVIVKDNQIIGQGFHQKAGEAHAEIHALREAGESALGATLYVTLEPCCHHGKTPPCTDALIAAKIKKVFVACLDPNPLMAGKGIEKLRASGIEIEVGLFEKEAQQLNEIFFHYIKNKKPFVVAKWAMSLDGKMQVNEDDNKQISGKEAHAHTHTLREQVDAILVGANTLRDDNPLLTVRKDICAKQPIRIVLAGSNALPKDLRIFANDFPGKTIITTYESAKHVFADFYAPNVALLIVKEKQGRIDLVNLLEELGKKQITSVLVEGGRTVHESFFKENLVNKVHVYIAPNFIGAHARKQLLHISEFTQLGNDFHFTVREMEHV